MTMEGWVFSTNMTALTCLLFNLRTHLEERKVGISLGEGGPRNVSAVPSLIRIRHSWVVPVGAMRTLR